MNRTRATCGIVLLLASANCSSKVDSAPAATFHSSSIALSSDGATLYVVNPDSDSVSFIDTAKNTLVREVLLTTALPAQDPTSLRYEPAAMPRALALSASGETLYVTGQRSGAVYAIHTSSGAITKQATICSEPIGILASRDGSSVYVACSEDSMVVKLNASSLAVSGKTTTSAKPWGLAFSEEDSSLYVTHLLGPGVSVIDPRTMDVSATWPLLDGPPVADPGTAATPPAVPDAGQPAWEDPLIAHGVVRGIYDVLVRPGSSEVWTAHLMLGIDTPEPALVFNNTAFPALSLFDPKGTPLARLSVTAVAGDNGAFGDVVSGPHAIDFTPDGQFAFVVDTNSEDLLIVDATARVEAALVRPLPGHQPEGVVVSRDGHVYIDERNTGDVAIVSYSVTAGVITASVTRTVAKSASPDPMPASMRLGQHLFHSANSDELPLTQDHWVACATCHIEERTDAVTWLFLEGPRDTPSNAGGVLNTGFLLRTAARRTVQDYWQTINAEQGGNFPNPDAGNSPGQTLLSGDLDAIASYVNYAIPYPTPPSNLEPSLVAAGQAVFQTYGCANCHAGPYFTDSGSGNSLLDLTGTPSAVAADGGVLLHDVGTCVTAGLYPDVAFPDELGDSRPACLFDTPTLRGIADTAPYLHDGSAATLADVLKHAAGMGASGLSASDQAALVEYLRSL